MAQTEGHIAERYPFAYLQARLVLPSIHLILEGDGFNKLRFPLGGRQGGKLLLTIHFLAGDLR